MKTENCKMKTIFKNDTNNGQIKKYAKNEHTNPIRCNAMCEIRFGEM